MLDWSETGGPPSTQPSWGSMTTGVPDGGPSTPSPSEATVPAPSEPSVHGSAIRRIEPLGDVHVAAIERGAHDADGDLARTGRGGRPVGNVQPVGAAELGQANGSQDAVRAIRWARRS